MSEPLSFQDVWAIAAAAGEFPDLVRVHDQTPYAADGATSEFKARVHRATQLGCAELLALANTFGGYALYGASDSNPPRFSGVRDYRLSPFEQAVREMAGRGQLGRALQLQRIQGLAEEPVLVIRVEKLRRPLRILTKGRLVIPKMRPDGVTRAAFPRDSEDSISYAESHEEAVRRRGALRRRRDQLIVGAPPRFINKSERRATAEKEKRELQRSQERKQAEERAQALRSAQALAEQQRKAAEIRRLKSRQSAGEDALSPPPLPDLLTWEVLPEAALEGRWLSAFHESNPSATSRERLEHFQRLRFLRSLNPDRFFEGRRLGERVYFVMVFGQFAVADSPQYGNALYYYRGADWRDVFSMPKREARKLGAGKVVHSGDWQERIEFLVSRQR